MVLLPGHAVRHVERSRAFDGGKQRPASPNDFASIVDILSVGRFSGDRKSAKGHKTLKVFGKTANGEDARLVFEVLPGKKNRAIALKSMVIKTK